MRFGRSHDPSRFALAVFVALVIFCLAQLTWWIVFQIERAGELTKLRLDMLNLDIDQAVKTVNSNFRNSAEIAMLAERLAAGNIEQLQGELDSLIATPAVAGYSIIDSDDSVRIHGKMDSTFYAEISPRCILYFDSKYPKDIMSYELAGKVVYSAEGKHDGGPESLWITSDMFPLSEDAREELHSEAHRRVTMFLSEGSVFVLLMLIGAYLIYRALQRSEDLKFRQQHFLQAVTHEFRAPLTSLRLYLEALHSGNVDRELAEELFPKMLDDCERLDGLIDNVLEAGHFGKSGYSLNLSATDLSEDLAEYLDGLEPLVRRFGGNIKRNIEENLPVRTDYHALRRVVRALVDNALRYSPAENRDIEVSLVKTGQRAEIRVADKGIGISKEEQVRVFDRFYRVSDDYSRGVSGTGLGLFLAREIIEAHHAEIWVDSEGPNRGSVFTISLPLHVK